LKAAGACGVDASRGTHFSLPDHGLQAAIDGAGVVLGWRTLSAPDIAAGRVVATFDLNLPLGNSFYLCYPQAQGQRKDIVVLRDWLEQEVFEHQE
jgi:LysR family glycine cleavage system transcriptional activator